MDREESLDGGGAVEIEASSMSSTSQNTLSEGSDELQSEGNSSAGSSNSGAEVGERPRPQAEPLPVKRGEIGFQERYQQQLTDTDAEDEQPPSTLPERHPADRRAASSTIEQQSGAGPPVNNGAEAPLVQETRPTTKHFTSKQLSFLGGVRLSTFLLLLLQIGLICGTIAGWVMFGIFSSASKSNNNNEVFSTNTSQIFGHVLFTLALLGQFVFLERRIYYVRAERWCYVHPGLPIHARERDGMTIGFAPWNRPPLPTYAAALAQSGVGTGDVEDNVIAIPPPPAYGNTRGSTLLLSGLINDTLRAQRRQERTRSGGGSVRDSRLSSRPVSYASHDEGWEERCDALRTLALANTLARLEDARVTTQDGELRRGASST